MIYKLLDEPDIKAVSRGMRKFIPTDNVIREGEKEGHKHEVTGQGMLFQAEGASPDDDRVIEAKGDTKIIHPEHPAIELPKGTYGVKIQKEFDGKEEKKARD